MISYNIHTKRKKPKHLGGTGAAKRYSFLRVLTSFLSILNDAFPKLTIGKHDINLPGEMPEGYPSEMYYKNLAEWCKTGQSF